MVLRGNAVYLYCAVAAEELTIIQTYIMACLSKL